MQIEKERTKKDLLIAIICFFLPIEMGLAEIEACAKDDHFSSHGMIDECSHFF